MTGLVPAIHDFVAGSDLDATHRPGMTTYWDQAFTPR